MEADSIDASGAGTIQLAGQGDVIGEDNDVVITVETKGAAADTSALYGVDNTTDLFVTEKNQLQEALVYFTAVNRAYCAANAGAVRLTADEIKTKMTRDIVVDLAADGTGYRVSVKYNYTCGGLKGEAGGAVTYDGLYLGDRCMDEVKGIYLLYNRMQQVDRVTVSRGTGVAITPDLYLVCQDKGISLYEVELLGMSNLERSTQMWRLGM